MSFVIGYLVGAVLTVVIWVAGGGPDPPMNPELQNSPTPPDAVG